MDSGTPLQDSPRILLAPKYDPPKKVKLRHPPHRPEDHRGGYQTSSSWLRPKRPGFGFVQLMKMWKLGKIELLHQSPSIVTPQRYQVGQFLPRSNLFLLSHLVTTDLREHAQGTGARRFSGFRSKGSENFTAKRPDTEIVCPYHQNFDVVTPVALCLGLVFAVLCLGFCYLKPLEDC